MMPEQLELNLLTQARDELFEIMKAKAGNNAPGEFERNYRRLTAFSRRIEALEELIEAKRPKAEWELELLGVLGLSK